MISKLGCCNHDYFSFANPVSVSLKPKGSGYISYQCKIVYDVSLTELNELKTLLNLTLNYICMNIIDTVLYILFSNILLDDKINA